jgi:hypothetical protein
LVADLERGFSPGANLDGFHTIADESLCGF